MSDITCVRDDLVRGDTGESTTAIQTFIRAVGERVRHARQEREMSQRALSDVSGISLRYLAQLENGGGNISIALLYKVARALGRPVDWFVGGEGDRGLDTTRETRKRRICLIGVRGAGKSTLGSKVGEAMSLPFVELNSDIEEQSGMPVEEVIALYGQEGFRALERQALERIMSATDEAIVAVAGGIVSDPEAYDFLLRNFHTIWLKATPEEHMNRVRAQGDYRPMAGNPQAMEELQSILTSREALYANAERTVNTSGKSVDESVREVLGVIGDLGFPAEPR